MSREVEIVFEDPPAPVVTEAPAPEPYEPPPGPRDLADGIEPERVERVEMLGPPPTDDAPEPEAQPAMCSDCGGIGQIAAALVTPTPPCSACGRAYPPPSKGARYVLCRTCMGKGHAINARERFELEELELSLSRTVRR